jgi:tRNA threonylcarbamoyladenosine biosynthesis protein TsaB
VSIHDVAGYGVTTGPGAFTAVRVGLTAVKALAEVEEKPVVPVSTLELIAAAGLAAGAAQPHAVLVPILDARRGQVFGAVYQAGGDGFRPLLPETVSSLSSFLEQVRTLAGSNVSFCGTDLDRFVPDIEKAGWGQGTLIRVSASLAGVLATIAAARLRQGFGVPALSVDANYVRASDAELFWKG